MESEDESSTGKRFPLCKANRHKDQFAPFENLFGFTSNTSHYNGTLFRFPFRRTLYHKTFSKKELKSKISDKIFTAEGAIQELFDTLCEEAAHLLLFLKSIESIDLYTWDPAEKKKKMFVQISLSDSCLPHVRQFRKTCQNSCQFNRSTTVMATCCVCLLSQSTEKQFNWLLCSTVGSSDAKLLELAAKLKVTPWSGVAAPLPLSVTVECIAECHLVTPQMNSETVVQTLSHHFRTPAEIVDDWRPPKEQEIGYPFCFLPLKDPTGLPVQVHGYFRVSSNRRSIEWPSQGNTGDEAVWNKHLVQMSLVPSYAVILAAKSFLFTYSRPPTDKVLFDPYSWWPLEQEIQNSLVWRDILECANLLSFMCGLKLFWSPSNGGQWIKGSDAVLVREGTPPLVARLLISFGCPIVNPPTPVKKTFNSLEGVDVLGEVTPQYVRKQLKTKRNQCPRDFDLVVAVLEYIVSDLSNDYSVLEGIPVIPVANSESAPVSLRRLYPSGTTERIFIVTDPDVYKLIPNLKDKMISPDLPNYLASIFLKIAHLGMYTLVEAMPDVICPQLISESMSKWIGQQSHRVKWTPGRNGMPGKDWLELLWKWIHRNDMSLRLLKELPIIPLQSIDVVTSSSLELVSTDSNLLCLRRTVQGDSLLEEMYRIAQTLGCTLIDHSSIFVHHTEELEQLLPTMTPQSLLNKMRSMPQIINKVMSLVNEDKNNLRTFLFEMLVHLSQVQLPRDLSNFLKSLPFFAVGVGVSSISYVSLYDPTVIFPPYDINNFPSDVHFPPKVLRVSPSDRTAYKALAEKPESCSHFITECYGPFAMNLDCAMKTKAFIWILQQYRLTRDQDLKKFLQREEFLLSMGGVSRRADQLYDPDDETLTKMFFESQSSYPASEFLPYLPELREIGLLTWQSVKNDEAVFKMFITDRARAISRSLSCNYAEAIECSKNILKALLIKDYHTILPQLKEINFLACEANPPQNYPSELTWAGAGMPPFLKPVSMCTGGRVDQMAHLIGSSSPLLSSAYVETVAQLYHKEGFKGFLKTNKMGAVCKHLTNIVSLPEAVCQRCGSYITESMEDIYRYLSKNLSAISQHLVPRKMWHEGLYMFLPFEKVMKETGVIVSLAPYLYSLKDIPGALKHGELWGAMNMKTKPIPSDYCQVLKDIKNEAAAIDQILSEDQVTMVVHILQYLRKQSFSGNILIPTTDGRLLPTRECIYDDRSLSDEKQSLLTTHKDIIFTHRDIPKAIATHFKVPFISSKIAKPKGFKITSNVYFEGQEIPLTRRISNIIKDYEDRIDVFKELIQNADDAGATEVKFLINWREHPTEYLMSAGMKHWQGPALYAYNDSVFTDEDFEHIKKVEGGMKLKDSNKIGRFGVGFCCTYQLTDVPSFVSRRQFVVFDPHRRYLRECAPNQTGIRIDYVSENTDMMSFYKDQLVPFQDVFGCNVLAPPSDVEEGYPHTLFRFPFRTQSTPRSDICGKVFDEKTACMWKTSFRTSAESMLVFLRHVNKVELYEVERGSSIATMKCVYSVTSTIEEHSGSSDLVQEYRLSSKPQSTVEWKGMKIKRISVKEFGDSDILQTENSKDVEIVSHDSHHLWMVSSALGSGDSLKMARKSQGLVPLAEVAVTVRREGSLLIPEPCTGQVFCFLPLPVSTDQKCLINGYFEVSTSRRNLLHLQAGRLGEKNKDHQWNCCLIQDALSEAFGNMLIDLQTCNSGNTQLPDSFLNSYYSIWPILNSHDDISRELKDKFVERQILSPVSRPLFFTQSCTWSSCDSVSVLSQSFLPTLTKAAVPDAVRILMDYGRKQVALNVPEEILTMLQGDIDVIEPIMYIQDVLLPNLEQIGTDDKEMRDKQIRFLLRRFRALEIEDEGLTDLMRSYCCIPTKPHGTLKKPTDLINSNKSQLADLYDVEEERFPLKHLLQRKEQVQALLELGMAESTLSDANVIDRANTVQVIASQHSIERARARSEKLQDYMIKIDYLSEEVKTKLKAVPFLPVKQRPPDISVPWCGDSPFEASFQMYDEEHLELIFTTGVVADCKSEIYNILQFRPPPSVDDVIYHLKSLHEWEKDHSLLQEEDRAFISKSVHCAYEFLDRFIRCMPSDQPLQLAIQFDSVWSETTFVPIKNLAMKSPIGISLAPYCMTGNEVPALRKYGLLWESLKIQKILSVQDCISILEQMAVSTEELNTKMITGIFQYLYESNELNDEQKNSLLLPTTMSTLVQCKLCCYDDRHWNERKKGSHLLNKYSFVDSLIVSQPLAEYFGVRPISNMLGNPEILRIKYDEEGQMLPVSRRINRILTEYKEVNDVFKELIQNADDAGATEVKFLVDWRQHPIETLFTDEMKHWQGPALYAYNNSVFSDQDFKNIYELEGATKKDDTTAIGRFGLGFCTTYHITDVPSFVSKDKIIFLDPLLKYLPRDKGGGGIRFEFLTQSDVIEEFYHDQMLPFEGVFGCKILGSTVQYNGTLFRFPFRTETQSGSELSQVTFDNQRINEMKESFMTSANLLPVFLQHVKTIELWVLEGNENDPQKMKMVLSVERDRPRSIQALQLFKDNVESGSLPLYSATDQFSVFVRRMDQEASPQKNVTQPAVCESREKWIVASALARPGSQSWNYVCSHKNDGLVPLTEVAISTKGQSMIPNLCYTGLGRVYCFLPLPIAINDLPCMINGCFAVPSNRRTLEDLENEDRNVWNRFLIKEVLVEAYLSLLHYLTTIMPTEEVIWEESLNAYYELWPIACLSHPLSKELHDGFLTALKYCNLPLANIPLEPGRWLPVNQVKILDVSFYEKVLLPIRDDILKVLLDRDYKVAEFTLDIIKSLNTHSIVSIFTFSTYCHDVLLSNWDVDDAELRDYQLFYVLKHFKALKEEHEWLEDLLKTSPCVPCEPDGTRCLPTTLICPEQMLKELYHVEEGQFPLPEFLKDDDVKETLIDLGMSQYELRDEDVVERAHTIQTLPNDQALERSNSLITYLVSVHCRELLKAYSISASDKPIQHLFPALLFDVHFLPVLQRPKGTSIPWFGDNHYFASPNDLNLLSSSYNTFAKGLVLDYDGSELQKLFGFKVPSLNDAQQNFEAIICWAEQHGDSISEADTLFLDNVMPKVYTYFSDSVSCTLLDSEYFSKLDSRHCIWQKVEYNGMLVSKFLSPSHVYSSKAHLRISFYPYLVKLSPENERYATLFHAFGVKESISAQQIPTVLKNITDDMDNTPIMTVDGLLDFVVSIAHLLTDLPDFKLVIQNLKDNNYHIYLPNEEGIMKESCQMAYKETVALDSNFVPAELMNGCTQFVHSQIPKQDAKLLGVEDLLLNIMSQFEDTEFLKEEEFGQKEDLCTRLNNILSQYPCDVSIFKEFIQNAEDATASEIAFVVDHRNDFGERSLFADHDSWKSLQRMPSLLIFNNRTFKKEDIESIKQLGVGGKGESLDKIGRFGIGFNVAYHITDCPMFVSYGEGGQAETFCVFDPNFHFVPKASRRKQPGARYIMKNVDGKNCSEHFQDQFAPFLGDIIPTVASTIKGCFDDYSARWPSGFAVFRLPLTRSKESYLDVTKLKDGYHMEISNLQQLVNNLRSQAPSMLLFLSHIQRISMFEISKDSEIVDAWSVAAKHTEDGGRMCAEFADNIQCMCSTICSSEDFTAISNSLNVTYNIEINTFLPTITSTTKNLVESAGEYPLAIGTPVETESHTSTQHSADKENPPSSPSITSPRNDPPKYWIISKRFGLSDIPSDLLYLAGDNHLFPIAGVAVPLPDKRSRQEFTGKLFTHLPLPLESGIPAHINAHFWVDQSLNIWKIQDLERELI